MRNSPLNPAQSGGGVVAADHCKVVVFVVVIFGVVVVSVVVAVVVVVVVGLVGTNFTVDVVGFIGSVEMIAHVESLYKKFLKKENKTQITYSNA